jgi:hypothetical protein
MEPLKYTQTPSGWILGGTSIIGASAIMLVPQTTQLQDYRAELAHYQPASPDLLDIGSTVIVLTAFGLAMKKLL